MKKFLKFSFASSCFVMLGATAFAQVGTELGPGANASGDANNIAIGNGAQATGVYSEAGGVRTGTDSGIAIGAAASASAMDAIAVGRAATASGNYSIAVGAETLSALYSTAVGWGSWADGVGGTSTGFQSWANGEQSTATGYQAYATGNRSTALGSQSSASGAFSTAIGAEANASGDNSVALGYQAIASAAQTSAVGYGAQATAGNGSAFGHLSKASEEFATALGTAAEAKAPNSVALGAYSIADQPNTVSVGSPGNERRIVNLAPGISGTDAVNLNQLQAVERKMSAGIASAMAMTPAQIAPGKQTAVSVGVGQYATSTALAFNMSRLVAENLILNAGISYGQNGADTTLGSNSNIGGKVSMSYSF